jgi:hypothetical protein
MSDVPKPVRVKFIGDEIFWNGKERKRKGDIFWLDLPSQFSKAGKMVLIDDNGNEIRHKGGYKQIKDQSGEVIQVIPMKGKPVLPGEEVLEPTQEEKEREAKKAAYEKELAELNKKYNIGEPEAKPKAPVQEVI